MFQSLEVCRFLSHQNIIDRCTTTPPPSHRAKVI